jgi:hypothetical protein
VRRIGSAGSAFEARRCRVSSGSFLVRPEILSVRPTARALRHEQTHFDLTEVHARRLRRYFTELVAPCKSSNSDLSNVAERYIRDEANAQANDGEPDHGRKPAEQARWTRKSTASCLRRPGISPGNGRQ